MLKRKKVRNGFVIGVLVLVVLAAALWFVVLSPRFSEADELSAQAEQIQMNNLSLQSQYNQTLADAQKATQAATEAQALFSKMPQEADLPQILQDITAAAAQAGIKGTDLRVLSTSIPQAIAPPAGAGAGVNLAKMAIGITAFGSHENLMAFLVNLQTLDRAMLISAVGINPEGPKQEVMTVDGSMFMLQSSLPDLVTTVAELIAQAEADGAIPTPGASDNASAGPVADGTASPAASPATSSVPAPLTPVASPTPSTPATP